MVSVPEGALGTIRTWLNEVKRLRYTEKIIRATRIVLKAQQLAQYTKCNNPLSTKP